MIAWVVLRFIGVSLPYSCNQMASRAVLMGGQVQSSLYAQVVNSNWLSDLPSNSPRIDILHHGFGQKGRPDPISLFYIADSHSLVNSGIKKLFICEWNHFCGLVILY